VSHPHTLDTQVSLSALAARQGRTYEAVSLPLKSIEGDRQAFGRIIREL